jgi:threonine synthase
MKNIGKTPLLRARNIEKVLGVKNLYLKLEGNNPKSSKYDRLAKSIINLAIVQNKNQIYIDGKKPLIKSLIYHLKAYDIKLLMPEAKRERWKNSFTESFVDYINLSNETKDFEINKLNQNQNYLVIDESTVQLLAKLSFENIASETLKRLNGEISSFTYYTDELYANEVYNEYFLKEQVKNQLPLPKIIEAKKEDLDLTLIEEAKNLLQRKEHLKVKDVDSLAFASFLKAFRNQELKPGNHVVVLDRAKSKINIEQINDFSVISRETLVDYVYNYLDRYSDSKTETLEAIELAMEKGFILVAKREEDIAGVVIIVNMGFEEFIPKYHLAYIGINPNNKGRGIGSDLIKAAIDLTQGNLSLHVDLDNKNARRLYKKMGFKHAYDRMIYQK